MFGPFLTRSADRFAQPDEARAAERRSDGGDGKASDSRGDTALDLKRLVPVDGDEEAQAHESPRKKARTDVDGLEGLTTFAPAHSSSPRRKAKAKRVPDHKALAAVAKTPRVDLRAVAPRPRKTTFVIRKVAATSASSGGRVDAGCAFFCRMRGMQLK